MYGKKQNELRHNNGERKEHHQAARTRAEARRAEWKRENWWHHYAMSADEFSRELEYEYELCDRIMQKLKDIDQDDRADELDGDLRAASKARSNLDAYLAKHPLAEFRD